MQLTSTGTPVIVPQERFFRRDLQGSDPYARAWASFRVIQVRAYTAALIGAVLTAIYLTYLLRGGRFEGLALLGFWIGSLLVVGRLVEAAVAEPCRWKCPRCGLGFFNPEAFGEPSVQGGHASGVNAFWFITQLCVNCGLPRWAPRDPLPAATAATRRPTSG